MFEFNHLYFEDEKHPRMKPLVANYDRPLIITVHGWKSPGGYMHTVALHAECRGYMAFCFNYGWMLAKSLRNKGIAERIVYFVDFWHRVTGQKVVGIGHSNGGELLWRASQMTEWLQGLVLINAALDEDIKFPDTLDFVHNWYSPSDHAVGFAQWIPGNKWGNLGGQAYTGLSQMVVDFNKEKDYLPHVSDSHSDQFTEPRVRDFFIPRQIDAITETLQELRNNEVTVYR